MSFPRGSLEWYYFKNILTPFHIIILQGVPHVKLQLQVFLHPPFHSNSMFKTCFENEGRLQRMPRQYASEISE